MWSIIQTVQTHSTKHIQQSSITVSHYRSLTQQSRYEPCSLGTYISIGTDVGGLISACLLISKNISGLVLRSNDIKKEGLTQLIHAAAINGCVQLLDISHNKCGVNSKVIQALSDLIGNKLPLPQINFFSGIQSRNAQPRRSHSRSRTRHHLHLSRFQHNRIIPIIFFLTPIS